MSILNKVKANKNKLLEEEKVKKEVERIAYIKMVEEAEGVKQKMIVEKKAPKDLKNVELRALLKPWKRAGDTAIPTLKKNAQAL